MYVSTVFNYRRVWINRVRLPILTMVSLTGNMNISLSPFAPENLVSRDGFGSPVLRRPTHSPYAYSLSILKLNLVLTHGIPPAFRGAVHLFIPPTALAPVLTLSGHAIAYQWRSLQRVGWHRASSPQGNSSNGCCPRKSPWINFCAPLFSHTHY